MSYEHRHSVGGRTARPRRRTWYLSTVGLVVVVSASVLGADQGFGSPVPARMPSAVVRSLASSAAPVSPRAELAERSRALTPSPTPAAASSTVAAPAPSTTVPPIPASPTRPTIPAAKSEEPTTPAPIPAAAAPVTPPSPAMVAAPAASTANGIAANVLAMLNDERASANLAPLQSNPDLVASAHSHNLAMAQADTMSHQLPGEPDLGTRITAAGYSWQACGENIGYTTSLTVSGARSIEQSMFDETPPNDGHRLNILSTTFVDVGVDVVISGGRLWLTQDFGAQ